MAANSAVLPTIWTSRPWLLRYRGQAPVINPPLLQRDDAWELQTLGFMECDAVAQPHTVQQGLGDMRFLACVQFNHSVVISNPDSAELAFQAEAILNAFLMVF